MKLEITMTKEMEATFTKLKATREGKSDQELFVQVVERGLYDLNYRSARNKKVWGQFKAFRATQKGE